MIEKRKLVNNPLNLIPIFLGIPILLLFVSKTVSVELQILLFYFSSGYILLITLLTFITILFKPEVLYSPKDYKNEKNFIQAMKSKKEVKKTKSIVCLELENKEKN